ncbi:MAG TPA: LssY C-terminal domain-containing protein [Candidatus Saccharimonadales bacterium]|nr:LssY C-terminal domain-containing protein [Candidatus Saccharimonadales bacterium]
MIKLLKRFAVLIPGIVIAYFSVRDIFPYFDKRLPLGVAVLATYVLGAYVLIPTIIRLLRVFYPANHLPLYCVTPDGFASDPINIGVISTRRELITAMERAGWFLADPHSVRHLPRHALSTVFGRPYPNAPVSSLYLFGRRQDLAFEIPIKGSRGSRHHVRFWATNFKRRGRLAVHSIYWHHRREHLQDDNLLWVGAASLDVGLAPIRHNLQLTHMVHPDTNSERELIIAQLRAAGLVAKVEKLKLGDPYRLVNRAWRGYLHTDGKMSVITPKKNGPSK